MFPFYLPNYFSLLNLCFLPDSLFQFAYKDGEEVMISGINVPWIYYGMIFSTFCWHIEDLSLYSVNYLHDGEPKVWYSIPAKDKEKYDNLVKNKFLINSMNDESFINKLSIYVNPLELLENGITVRRTVQKKGEIIITLPKGYHFGFSLGLNKSEAVNFATCKWLEYGKDTLKEYIKYNLRPPVFSIEWLLFNNNYYKNDIILSENSIKKVNNQIQKHIDIELDHREKVDNYCNSNNFTRVISSFESKNSVACCKCLNLNYLSYYECHVCKAKSCISHLDFICCGNEEKKANLFYKHKNDLYYHSKNIKPNYIPKISLPSKEMNKGGKSNKEINNLSLKEYSNYSSTEEN